MQRPHKRSPQIPSLYDWRRSRRFAKAEQDESKGLRRKQTRARRKTERADMKEELSQAKKKIEQLEQPGRGEHGEGK